MPATHMPGKVNFLLAGVGGQGTLLAADLVALAGLQAGYDVKKSEVHGMAQRGGSVTSHVRWGERVYSPLIPAGEVDYLLAFERLEALRYADQVRPGGTLLINDQRITPITVTSGNSTYPGEEDEERAYAGTTLRCYYVPALSIAEQLGQARVNNVVLLGALSALLELPEELWQQVIAERVPAHTLALNKAAFAAGRALLEHA